MPWSCRLAATRGLLGKAGSLSQEGSRRRRRHSGFYVSALERGPRASPRDTPPTPPPEDGLSVPMCQPWSDYRCGNSAQPHSSANKLANCHK